MEDKQKIEKRQDNGQKINEKVTLQIASKVLQVSTKTIQRWIKNGKFSSTKEGKRIYIPTDEIRKILQEKKDTKEDIDLDKIKAVQTLAGQNESRDINIVPVERTHYEGLLTRLGQLESERKYLLEYKTGLEEKDQELERTREKAQNLKNEVQKLKSRSLWQRIFNKS